MTAWHFAKIFLEKNLPFGLFTKIMVHENFMLYSIVAVTIPLPQGGRLAEETRSAGKCISLIFECTFICFCLILTRGDSSCNMETWPKLCGRVP